ncbi:DUF3717 domain-containing protein [Bordetella pseudohinzii]|uniref:DUF3717 domain-containing protein n=1 Tax=Bordetella pseudohinzii TaxID=1331258 RepID=A0ABM6DLD2_9BORD|nr:DUF3717 domain-containing protein [Bordetella pseudohinzii]ANY18515.1 hypothetical protein BBN53_21060 [Bordetella pseudohinzii]KMM24085.1 hypothetical protein L540_08120 [Bordetella pseudohinzii]KXA77851.1 hypothetical protein AW878_14235 [Bordetella pseudohinzii]KXA78047.1 hypothetical protein AW877_12695 [Bordetella pseudohinzii]
MTGTPCPHVLIQQIETAINYWRAQANGTDGISISREVSVLADCYGMMIYAGVSTVPVTALAPAQLRALKLASSALA